MNNLSKFLKDENININNYGVTEVQIFNLTNKINLLHKHCILNKKDFHSKRGLIFRISKRKKLLNYLKKNFYSRYIKIYNLLKKNKI